MNKINKEEQFRLLCRARVTISVNVGLLRENIAYDLKITFPGNYGKWKVMQMYIQLTQYILNGIYI
jgi:ABC-type transporter MlaC component